MRFFSERGQVLLIAAVLAAVAVPNVSYAQLGGLANLAKGKAAEVLTNKVMDGLEKKFAETVAKEPISEAAKANIVKKLSEMARPVVKKTIDGAMSGKLPNPAELVQTVLKDILPQVPQLVAAVKAGGDGAFAVASSQGEYGQQAYGAGSAQQLQPMSERPKLAVYVFGAEEPAINKAMVSRLITALSNSGRYQTAQKYREFFEHATEEQQKNGAASMKTEQIKVLGEQFGAEYICVAEITTVFGERQVSAHIFNVETAEITATGVADVSLKTPADLSVASEQIVETMSKNASPPVAKAKPIYATAPQPLSSPHTYYTLTTNVLPSGGGSVSRSPNQTGYISGTNVTVTAIPTNGYTFTGWSGTSKPDTSHNLLIAMNGYKTLTANFKVDVLTGTFTDSRDGKAYNTVKIGNQMWMAENLKYRTSSGSWCYGNDSSNCDKYGRLYDWNTAMTACPSGWHLSTDQEWSNLITAVGSSAGTKLKAAIGWDKNGDNGNNTDDYGFSALPGGKRSYDGNFSTVGNSGYWWTALKLRDAAAYRHIYYGFGSVRDGINRNDGGFSVRCVEDTRR